MNNGKAVLDNVAYDLMHHHNITKKESIQAVKYIIQYIIKRLKSRRSIKILSFATFSVKVRQQKKTTHPQTNQHYIIPKRYILLCTFIKKFMSKNER